MSSRVHVPSEFLALSEQCVGTPAKPELSSEWATVVRKRQLTPIEIGLSHEG